MSRLIVPCWLLYTAVLLPVELPAAAHTLLQVDYYVKGAANHIRTVKVSLQHYSGQLKNKNLFFETQ